MYYPQVDYKDRSTKMCLCVCERMTQKMLTISKNSLISNFKYSLSTKRRNYPSFFLDKSTKTNCKKKSSFFFKGYLLNSCWRTGGTLRLPVPRTAIHGGFLPGSPPTSVFRTHLQSNTKHHEICSTLLELKYHRDPDPWPRLSSWSHRVRPLPLTSPVSAQVMFWQQ